MKKFYLAAFMPAQEGGYDIIISDVPGAVTCADTLEEAFVVAEDVLSHALRNMAGDKKSVPEPSPIEAVREKTVVHLEEIGHEPAGEILYQLIPAPSLDMTPVKVTISLPKAILEEIDVLAKSGGYTRSGFLAQAAQAYPHRQ